MKKKSTVVAIAIAGALLVLVFALLLSPPGGGKTEEKTVVIKKGYSAGEVASLLRGEGLIRSEALFLAMLRLSGADKSIQAGTYRIAGGTGLPAIVAILAEGKVAQGQVTIPEGSTARIVGDILQKAGICSQAGFLAAANDASLAADAGIPAPRFEGFLFPDTYLFPENSDPELIVREMARNFFEKLKSITSGRDIDGRALFDEVILASIVEREYRIPPEAGLMASVFKNRLEIGMALQSCATVVYIITERQGKPHPSVVYFSDLEIQDPYNTYMRRGLPPGPISNPGETALRAVFNTPESDYLYFRLIDEAAGSHKFSRSFEEHRTDAIPVKGL